MREMVLWEFFLGEDFNPSQGELGRVISTAAKNYNRTLKRGMKKSKKFLFFTVRTGVRVSGDKSIRVIARESNDGWIMILDMIIEKFERSMVPVDMIRYEYVTGIHALYDGVGQWSFKCIKTN